ncbi:MAG TPA: hypothetical protein VFD01_04630 [Candidatus Dormibacteraeota bacterium]|jgi:hypothetical protein|nr:hypothetical protein [Candidatus Dormibacteraeota bacterium]
MTRFAVIAQPLVGIVGLAMVVLGILFWTGHALTLVPVHLLLGLLLVLLLWALALLGAATGANPIQVGVTGLWGLLMPIFGLTQDALLVGAVHVVIQVLHLLVGLTAIALAQRLARQIRRRTSG